MIHFIVAAGMVCICLLGNVSAGFAGSESTVVVQSAGKGTVLWTDGAVSAKGTGVPPAGALSLPQAQAMAVRAATLEARRNLIDAVRGIHISGFEKAGDVLDKNPDMLEQVTALVQNSRFKGRNVLPDGIVEAEVELFFADGLLHSLLPHGLPFLAAVSGSSGDGEANNSFVTGVIIDARGLPVLPALLPRLLSSDGHVLYSLKQAVRKNVLTHGLATYASSPDAEVVRTLTGDSPLLLKAVSVAGGSSVDIVVDGQEVAALNSASGRQAMAQCRVAVIIDPVN